MILKEKMIHKIAKYVEKKIQKEKTDWPPICIGPFYQPKRPGNTDVKKEL